MRSDYVNASEHTSAHPQLPEHARCLQCRYSLRDLPASRCPECGRPFLSDEPDSYFDPLRESRRRAAWRSFWFDEARRVPSRGYVAGVAFLAGLLTVLATAPAGVWLMDQWIDRPSGVRLIPAILAAITAAESLRVLVSAWVRPIPGVSEVPETGPAARRRIVAVRVLVAISWLTFYYPWPLALRVCSYADELERLAILDARGGPPLRWRMVGPVLVRRVRSDSPPSFLVATDDWIHRLINRSAYRYDDPAIGLRFDPKHAAMCGRRRLLGSWYVE